MGWRMIIQDTLLAHAHKAKENKSGHAMLSHVVSRQAYDEIRLLNARVIALEEAALEAASEWSGDAVDTGAATVVQLPPRSEEDHND